MKLPIHRMVIGLALKGDFFPDETNTKAMVFVGTFPRKRDAETLAAAIPQAKSHGYLNGRYERGWSVIAIGTPEQAERLRQGHEATAVFTR
jgi:hypothetical protein